VRERDFQIAFER
jgi:hypothetical protein